MWATCTDYSFIEKLNDIRSMEIKYQIDCSVFVLVLWNLNLF